MTTVKQRLVRVMAWAVLTAWAALAFGQQSIPPFTTTYGNFSNGFKLGGSYGSLGQCPVSTGTGVGWSACGSSGMVYPGAGLAKSTGSAWTAFTPTQCSTGQAPTGIDANGNATGCQPVVGGGGIIPTDAYSVWGGDSINGDDNAVLAPNTPVANWSCDGISLCTVNTNSPIQGKTGDLFDVSHMTGWFAAPSPYIEGNGYTIFPITVTSSTSFTFPYSANSGSCASSCQYVWSAMNYMPYATAQKPGMPSAFLSNTTMLLFNGPTIAGMDSDYTTVLHPLSPAITGKTGYLMVQDFNNDVEGIAGNCNASAVQVEGYYLDIFAKAHVDNWRVGAASMIGRDQVMNNCPSMPKTVQTINQWLATVGTPTTIQTISTTATASSGSTTLTVASADNIMLNDPVSGTGLAQGTFVTAISGTSITISQATTGALSSAAVTFMGGAYWDYFADLDQVVNDGGDRNLIASNGGFGPAGANLASIKWATVLQGAGGPLQKAGGGIYSDNGFRWTPTADSPTGYELDDASGNPLLNVSGTYQNAVVSSRGGKNAFVVNGVTNASTVPAAITSNITPSGHGWQNDVVLFLGPYNSSYNLTNAGVQIGYNYDVLSGITNSLFFDLDRSSTDAIHLTIYGACVGVPSLGLGVSTGAPACPTTNPFSVGATAQFTVDPNGHPALAGCGSGTYFKADGTGCGTPSGGSGVADTTVAVSGGTQTANTCSTTSNVTMTGLSTSMVVSAGYSGSPSGLTGWGSTGGMVFHIWPSAANTAAWEVCNQTGTSITYSAVTFNVGAL